MSKEIESVIKNSLNNDNKKDQDQTFKMINSCNHFKKN